MGLLFRLFFVVSLGIWLTLLLPFLLAPDVKIIYRGVTKYAWFIYWVMEKMVGAKVEFRGLENLPRNSPYIFSPKHESTLDALMLWAILPGFTALVKKELYLVPVLGWILKKHDFYAIDRHSGTAHEDMPRIAKAVAAGNLPIAIFPEGTRARNSETSKLRSGAYHMQADAGGIPVITVATNSGYFWPVKGMAMRSGRVIFEIHPPMPGGLEKEEFMAELKRRVIDRSAELKREATEQDRSS